MAVRNVQPTAANVGTNQDSKNLLRQLIGVVNNLSNAMNDLTAKLDADAGVTDTDYASEIGTQDTIRLLGEDSDPS